METIETLFDLLLKEYENDETIDNI